jgi:hypothetical protein
MPAVNLLQAALNALMNRAAKMDGTLYFAAAGMLPFWMPVVALLCRASARAAYAVSGRLGRLFAGGGKSGQ